LFWWSAFFASGLAAQPIVIDGEVPAEGGFLRVTLLQGLVHPWSMAWLPNGDLLVTERPGRLRLVKGGRLCSRSDRSVSPRYLPLVKVACLMSVYTLVFLKTG
jgi:glucose/arabinose dehydrogenase